MFLSDMQWAKENGVQLEHILALKKLKEEAVIALLSKQTQGVKCTLMLELTMTVTLMVFHKVPGVRGAYS
ncbi:hypothetical protein NQ318_013142 [Aromia moschata]|uniref:Uncharacterized protein n=1 Tax=Aromia moschata TaxID=1265417 RepID=A0AAV8Y165_9CUCU|nr:hypothetical protein NQ318_013142 [Aromia moschata]